MSRARRLPPADHRAHGRESCRITVSAFFSSASTFCAAPRGARSAASPRPPRARDFEPMPRWRSSRRKAQSREKNQHRNPSVRGRRGGSRRSRGALSCGLSAIAYARRGLNNSISHPGPRRTPADHHRPCAACRRPPAATPSSSRKHLVGRCRRSGLHGLPAAGSGQREAGTLALEQHEPRVRGTRAAPCHGCGPPSARAGRDQARARRAGKAFAQRPSRPSSIAHGARPARGASARRRSRVFARSP